LVEKDEGFANSARSPRGIIGKGEKPEKMDNDVWEEIDAKAANAIHLNLSNEVIHNVIDEENAESIWQKLKSLYMAKNLTNKLYVKKQLYGLQIKENTDLLEHFNKFNMLNTQLLNFAVTIGEEDKAIFLLAPLLPSYDHLVTTLLYGKETLAFKEVTRSLFSHETWKKPVNDQADGLVARFKPKCGRDKFKGKNGRGKQSRSMSRSAQGGESRLDAKDVEYYYCHKKGHYKNFCRLMKQDLEDKKNQKGSANSVSVADGESNDNKVNTDVLSVSSGKNSLIDS
jgi:hypothetical protein